MVIERALRDSPAVAVLEAKGPTSFARRLSRHVVDRAVDRRRRAGGWAPAPCSRSGGRVPRSDCSRMFFGCRDGLPQTHRPDAHRHCAPWSQVPAQRISCYGRPKQHLLMKCALLTGSGGDGSGGCGSGCRCRPASQKADQRSKVRGGKGRSRREHAAHPARRRPTRTRRTACVTT